MDFQQVLLRTAVCLTLLHCGAFASAQVGPRLRSPQILEVELRHGNFFGLPVHWSNREAVLLQSSGQFQAFALTDLIAHRLLRDDFRPQSLAMARSELAVELGEGFDTLVTGPYVIAAPQGTADRWSARFRTLWGCYQRYFESRGWQLRQPDFPLIVIVFPDQAAFERYAQLQAGPLPENTLGSYFPGSNRCILYQIPNGQGIDWAATEATIVHEAVHQLAYNTGVHERLFENPLWFVEGLATMFEVPAVYDTRVARSSITDRMHSEMQVRLKSLLAVPNEFEQQVASLIVSDDLFRAQPPEAYAIGWAMTFTLSERMPRQMARFQQLQVQRPFGTYTNAERRIDFQTAFETAPDMLAYQIRRLLAE